MLKPTGDVIYIFLTGLDGIIITMSGMIARSNLLNILTVESLQCIIVFNTT